MQRNPSLTPRKKARKETKRMRSGERKETEKKKTFPEKTE
jgi:hypothetical protein